MYLLFVNNSIFILLSFLIGLISKIEIISAVWLNLALHTAVLLSWARFFSLQIPQSSGVILRSARSRPSSTPVSALK